VQSYLLPVSSAVGTWHVEGTAEGVIHIHLPNSKQTASTGKAPAPVTTCAKQLSEYFAGKRRDFDVQLVEPTGTTFQKNVWRALSRIPFGEVRTYTQIARAVKNPKSARAVGNANHANPYAVIVPCHRVVSASGIGGYGGGEKVKRFLLSLEGVDYD
jgi:methylated-DNA-[protein]-cysteine S-methyltransferase